MPIKVIIIWTCEICGKEELQAKDESLYSDPVIQKDGWEYISDFDKLACPECLEKYIN